LGFGDWRRLVRGDRGGWLRFASDAVIIFFELVGDFNEDLMRSVEKITVVKNFNHIQVELLWGGIFPRFELSLNRG
jgi:hypothetical protein